MKYSLTIVILLCLPMFIWGQAKPAVVAQRMKEYAKSIETSDPAHDNSDLAFLKPILIDKAVIGLGESTHGTKEIFQLKHRLLKYMVEELGYRHFAMEANFAECCVINDYVINGNGDPEVAIRGIYFWTWNTMEVLNMVKWMRAYNTNKAEEDKVSFWGFDMQYTIGSAKAIQNDLNRLNINYEKYSIILDSLSKNKRYYHVSDSSTREKVMNSINDLKNYAETYKDSFVERSSVKEYKIHCQYINTILQALGLYMNTMDRDSCMARNIEWITQYTGTDKIVLWAHNGHITQTTLTEGAQQMGARLNAIFGDSYYAVGFDIGTGSFNSKKIKYIEKDKYYELTEFYISKTIRNSTDYTFRKLNIPIFFLDYNSASKDDVINTFLSTDIKSKVIGAIFLPKWKSSHYYYMKLNEAFDATLYIDKTTASVLIPSYIQYLDNRKKIDMK